MLAIDDRFIEDLTSRLNITEIVSRYVQLNKKGGRYWGLCPFHNEKTASFSVSEDMQLFYCFGCRAGGGVIGFIQKIEHLEFQDAVAFLAKIAGMTIPENSGDNERYKRRDRLLKLNRDAAMYFHDTLMGNAGQTARAYIDIRGILPRFVTRFGIGFAPDGWDGLMTAMIARGYDRTELLLAGLASKNDKGNVYDKFRNRMMFPIIDMSGNVVAFGGRVLDDSLPKYLNSPETPIYHKSSHLFAMNLAKKSKSSRIILAEGYMDVLALHQAGFDSAVASLGTALTSEQADMIKKRANDVVIAYDADEAGQAAVARALEIFRQKELKANVLVVPGAKDPDEFIKKNGADAFAALLDGAKPSGDYKLMKLAAKYNMTDDEQRVAFVREAAELLSTFFGVEREVYTNKCADIAKIRAEIVRDETLRVGKKTVKREEYRRKRETMAPINAAQPPIRGQKYKNMALARAIEGIIAVLYRNPELISNIYGKIEKEWLNEELLYKIYDEMTRRLLEKRSISPDSMAEAIGPDALTIYTGILAGKAGNGSPKSLLEDYLGIIMRENAKSTAVSDMDALRTLLELKRQDKRYG